MKTLDEVIKALEICTSDRGGCEGCPYDHDCKQDKKWDTKEWLNIEKRNYAEAVKNCEMAEVKYTQMTLDMNRNVPLTWDELKQMEGKPVWIELLNHGIWDDPSHRVDSEWWVIGEVRKDDIILATYLDEMELCEEDIGVSWKAYRKERK